MMRCPSELELEAYLLDPSQSELAPHLGACARCRSQIAGMQLLGDEFRREVFPRTLDAVAERSLRLRVPRWILAVGTLSTAAAAAILLFVVRPPSGYLGVKGEELGLTVFVNEAGSVRAARDGEEVAARASMRFQIRPAHECRLWVVSVDGAGQVSRLFPASGEAVDVASAATLPGGAVLDGRAGPERIFAVCTPAPLAYPDLERAARAAAAGGEAAVRSTRSLAGLPRGAYQATILFEKRP